LLAEDSRVSQGILRLLLTQRGHHVDVVGDGEQALSALRNGEYEIVLMDFHLPKLDGLQATAKFKSEAREKSKLPRFIGITADPQGLLAHPDNCENFDLVIAKPIDIVHLCGVVEDFDRYVAWTRHIASECGAPFPIIPADNGGSSGQLGENGAERRRNKRVPLGQSTTVIILRNDEAFECRVLDLSLSGAALQLAARPPIGERVRVGRTEGRVVRHTNDGIAVEFVIAR
jgi:CheY-like chemotaxis protein